MKIFLHIGDARTGSSTLQAVLMHNRARLGKLGVDYPILGTREGIGVAHHKLSFSLLPTWPPHSPITPVPADQIWTDLTAYVDRLGAHTVVLSSEAFLNLPADGISYIKEALAAHDVTPICVQRDPEDWRRSWLAHRIRQGDVVQPPKQPARDLLGPKLERWRAVFDVTTVAYSERVLEDVLTAMGLDPSALDILERRNESCPDDVLELLNVLNALELSEANRGRFEATVQELMDGASLTLPDATLDQTDRVTFNQMVIDQLT